MRDLAVMESIGAYIYGK